MIKKTIENIRLHYVRLILITILFLIGFAIGNTAKAADVNGYTAKYECRAGGPNCNVDVATLAAQACQQTIATGDAWSTINWSNNVICLANGDHTAKGTLTIGSSGTSGTRKVLRYYRSGDTDDEPWTQTIRASIHSINMGNSDYWIIHRLSLDDDNTAANRIVIGGLSNHVILSRILMENFSNIGTNEGIFINTDAGEGPTWVQNSVVRNCVPNVGASLSGIAMGRGNTYVVNNETYNCTMNIWLHATGFDVSDIVVENNDSYLTTAYYYNCSTGVQDISGDCSAAENGLIALKAGGVTSSPIKIIHNRVWGMRPCVTSVACDGGGTDGGAIMVGANNQQDINYILVQNNIAMDSEAGIWQTILSPATSNRNSFIGNILYDIRGHGSSPITEEGGISSCCSSTETTFEIYLNTIVNGTVPWLRSDNGVNHDVRCNVAISMDAAVEIAGTGTQINYNVYYGTTDSGETNKLGNYALNTRANSTAYGLNSIIRTTATPPADGTAGDFLYKVTTAGTSASSPPSYCATLGCTTTDGSVTVRAVRGPYSFYQKLRTGAELVYIPYARMDTAATEAGFCPFGFASRSGIGVDNTQP